MASKNSIKVLVTGASGFVATHCVQQLLVGGYTVRGTVRSLKNPEKVQPLRDLNFAKERLELVEADLEKPDTWPKAVDSCKYVLHVASPFPTNPDENTIKVAVDGTLNVLKACAKCHSVEKVVLTSSIAAIAFGHEDSNKTFTEKDWTNIDGKSVTDYIKSKTIAERAAWDFVKSIPEGDNKFKLTCLNPGGIFGPSLTDIQGTSVEIVKRLLNHEMPGLPHLGVAAVDVRDVAKAHILAMENPNSDGERILLCHEASLWLTDLAKFLDKEFGPQGTGSSFQCLNSFSSSAVKEKNAPNFVLYHMASTLKRYCIPKRNLPYFLVWLVSFFDSSVKGILPMIGHAVKLDNSKAKNILHLEFIHPEKSLVDMGYSLIERGIVPKKSGYKPRTRL